MLPEPVRLSSLESISFFARRSTRSINRSSLMSRSIVSALRMLMLTRFVWIAVDLKTCAPQAWDPVSVDVAFPGEYLIDRQVVEMAGVLYRKPPSAHGVDHSGLAPYRPPLPRRGQLRQRPGYVLASKGAQIAAAAHTAPPQTA